jgi:hypothetical protein
MAGRYTPEHYHAEIEGHKWHLLKDAMGSLRSGFEYLVFDRVYQEAFVGVLERGTARSNGEWYWAGDGCHPMNRETQLVCFIPPIPEELSKTMYLELDED